MRFLHATSSSEALIGILQHGLIINPCERGIIDAFTNRPELLRPEPQHFGMVCVHGFKLVPNTRYWKQFGPFGIELAPWWVYGAGLRRVLYLNRESLVFKEHKRVFDWALGEADRVVRSQHPEDSFRKQAYVSKNAALVLGAHQWAEFLTQYAYMERHQHTYQQEWRFVREVPFRIKESIAEIVQLLNRDAGWSRLIYTLPVPHEAVIRLIAPKKDIPLLRKQLPSDYKGAPFVRFGLPLAFAMWKRRAKATLEGPGPGVPPVRDGFDTPRWR